MFRFSRIFLKYSKFAAMGGLWAWAHSAAAATFIVDTTADGNDDVPGDGTCATNTGVCTVRAAVHEANALSGADTVSIPAGTYTLTRNALDGQDDLYFADALTLSSDLTLVGAGASSTVLVGNGYAPVIGIVATTADSITLQDLALQGDTTATECDAGCVIHNTDATLTLDGVTVTDGYAHASDGGAAALEGAGLANYGGEVTITGSTFTGNSAWSDNATDLGQANGGAIYNDGTMTIEDSTLSSNEAIGGALRQATGAGGAIYNDGDLTLDGVVVEYNEADGYGGGLYSTGTVAITASTLRYNETTYWADPNWGCGGAIAAFGGSVDVERSTFDHNDADLFGGGVYGYGTIWYFDNTTFSTNSGGYGGGVYADAGNFTLNNVTITRNRGTTHAQSGGLYNASATVTLQNTLLTRNALGTSTPDCYGTITSGGYNLVSVTRVGPVVFCAGISGTGDQAGTSAAPIDAKLVSILANNGGTTANHNLQAGSPAMDAGSNSTCNPVDQRNRARPRDGDANGTSICDIGAVEYTRR